MNPYSAEMMKTYYAFKVLKGLDNNCSEYISVADTFASVSAVSQSASVIESQTVSQLKTAIIKGLKDKSASLTKELLTTSEPLKIVDVEIIPALNVVGEGFEKKTGYLPQLLKSAEAASEAFEVIKS